MYDVRSVSQELWRRAGITPRQAWLSLRALRTSSSSSHRPQVHPSARDRHPNPARVHKIPPQRVGKPTLGRRMMYEVWIITTDGKIIPGFVSDEVIRMGFSNRLKGEDIELTIAEGWKIPDVEVLSVKDLWVRTA